VNGERGVAEETAWAIGKALRELGADTNEVEALWAGAFFPELLRILHHIAADIRDHGPKTAVQLFAALPARMLRFELELMKGEEITAARGARYLRDYQTILKTGITHTEEHRYDPKTQTKYYLSSLEIEKISEKLNQPARFAQYERAQKALMRGDVPEGGIMKGGWSIAAELRGDDDLMNILVDVARKEGASWLPSLLIVRLWRLASEWISDLSFSSNVELEIIPDLFLPLLQQRQRDLELGAHYSSITYDR
jgi:hypothetical protein